MRETAMLLWAVLCTPVLMLVDRALAWWLRRRGYVLVEEWALDGGRVALAETAMYIRRSGHLNTVSGRRPRAVRRVSESVAKAFQLATPVMPDLGRGALCPRDFIRKALPRDPNAGAVV